MCVIHNSHFFLSVYHIKKYTVKSKGLDRIKMKNILNKNKSAICTLLT